MEVKESKASKVATVGDDGKIVSVIDCLASLRGDGRFDANGYVQGGTSTGVAPITVTAYHSSIGDDFKMSARDVFWKGHMDVAMRMSTIGPYSRNFCLPLSAQDRSVST